MIQKVIHKKDLRKSDSIDVSAGSVDGMYGEITVNFNGRE